MLYVATYSRAYDHDREEDCVAIVEAENFAEAIAKFRALIQTSKQAGAVFQGPGRIAGDVLVEVRQIPAEGLVVASFETSGGSVTVRDVPSDPGEDVAVGYDGPWSDLAVPCN